MSQMAAEAPPAAPAPAGPARRGGGNVFTRKIGPLPMWVWLAIGIGLIGVYYVWHRNQASQQATTTPTGTDASQVPQFVNQTYTSVTPPAAPATPAPVTTPAQTCPKGQVWDADEKKCIPEPKHKPKPKPKPKPKAKG